MRLHLKLYFCCAWSDTSFSICHRRTAVIHKWEKEKKKRKKMNVNINIELIRSTMIQRHQPLFLKTNNIFKTTINTVGLHRSTVYWHKIDNFLSDMAASSFISLLTSGHHHSSPQLSAAWTDSFSSWQWWIWTGSDYFPASSLVMLTSALFFLTAQLSSEGTRDVLIYSLVPAAVTVLINTVLNSNVHTVFEFVFIYLHVVSRAFGIVTAITTWTIFFSISFLLLFITTVHELSLL